MDINSMDQGLLIRNPSLTRDQFSEHWYAKHALLVIPMFLHLGKQHYQQTHAPFSSNDKDLDLSSFDGVAGLPPQETLDAPSALPSWVQAYYHEVVKADERRFLVSEALQHIKRVPPGTVKGEVRVVIREGKALVKVPESVWNIWREYEERGRREKEENGKDGKSEEE